MEDRLCFNILIRVFFAELVIAVDRPGYGLEAWDQKSELREYARLTKLALSAQFDVFVTESGLEMPERLMNAERQSYVYRCSTNSSLMLTKRYIANVEFIESFKMFATRSS